MLSLKQGTRLDAWLGHHCIKRGRGAVSFVETGLVHATIGISLLMNITCNRISDIEDNDYEDHWPRLALLGILYCPNCCALLLRLVI